MVFQHPLGETVWVNPQEPIFVDRRPGNSAAMVTAFVWRPCPHAAQHQTSGGAEPAMLSARLVTPDRKAFTSAGICRDSGGGREALYQWPANGAAIQMT